MKMQHLDAFSPSIHTDKIENWDIWKRSLLKMKLDEYGFRNEAFWKRISVDSETGANRDIWKRWRSITLNLPLSYYFDNSW